MRNKISLKEKSPTKETKAFGDFLCLILLSFTTRPGIMAKVAVTTVTRGGDEEIHPHLGHFL